MGFVPSARRQTIVDAPVETVWELIGDVSRHPEWWPRVEDVQGDALAVGDTYRQVTRRPMRTFRTTMSIESLEDFQELRIRCVDTGTYAHFVLTPAQDGTFVDGEIGVEERGIARVLAGAFVRRWLAAALDGLRGAAASAARAGKQPGEKSGDNSTA